MGDPTKRPRRLTSEPTRFDLSGHQGLINTGPFATSADCEQALFDEHGLCPFHRGARKPAHFDDLADGNRVLELAESPRFPHDSGVDDEFRRREVAKPVLHDRVGNWGESEGDAAFALLHV